MSESRYWEDNSNQMPKVRRCHWCGEKFVRFAAGHTIPRGAKFLVGRKWIEQIYPVSRLRKYCCRDHNRRAYVMKVCNQIERERYTGDLRAR